MSRWTLGADGQAIALLCSNLALGTEREPKPLTSREWHTLSAALVHSPLKRPAELIARDPEEIRDLLGLNSQTATRMAQLLARGGQLAFELERLAARGIWVLTRAEDAYPARLKRLLQGAAPPVLYGAGEQSSLELDALAVVGSRDASIEALEFTRELARACARQHVAIVSGAARGVDREAMGAAINAGGTALGVTVDPLERLIRRPEMRTALAEGTMTLLTPFHPSTRWQAGNAMKRNRLIYALSGAAVVAASTAGSGGTWSGAIENLQRRWVPTFVRQDSSPGSRELQRAGAFPLAPQAIADLDVRRLFQMQQPTLLTPEAPPTEHAANGHPLPASDVALDDDVFTHVWPLIAARLQSPRSEREVAEDLNLQLLQTRSWLERAVQEGLVSSRKRPKKVYVVIEHDTRQLRLG